MKCFTDIIKANISYQIIQVKLQYFINFQKIFKKKTLKKTKGFKILAKY